MSRGNESSDRQVDDLKPPPWRCAVHHLQVPDGDCPKCDDELIALTEQQAAEADPTAGERARLASESLSQEERRTFNCWCIALDGVRTHDRFCPVPAVERIVAAREAKARAEAGEQALRDAAHEMWRIFLRLPHTPSPLGDYIQRRVLELRARADRIAREVTRPDATGPVDWDSPTWGGGRHEAAWAPDGTHDDNAQDD